MPNQAEEYLASLTLSIVVLKDYIKRCPKSTEAEEELNKLRIERDALINFLRKGL